MHEISIVIGVAKISFRPSSNNPDEKFWNLQIKDTKYYKKLYTFKTSNLVVKQRIFDALKNKYSKLMRIANILMEVNYPSIPSRSILEMLFMISSLIKIKMRGLSISLDVNMMDLIMSNKLTADSPVWKLYIKNEQIHYTHYLKKEEAETIFIDLNFKELVIKLKSQKNRNAKMIAAEIESAILFESQEQKNKITKYYSALAQTKQTSPSFFQNVPKPIMLRIAAFAAEPNLKVITADEISKHLFNL